MVNPVEFDTCPDCGSAHIVPDGGCVSCHDCGWAGCSM